MDDLCLGPHPLTRYPGLDHRELFSYSDLLDASYHVTRNPSSITRQIKTRLSSIPLVPILNSNVKAEDPHVGKFSETLCLPHRCFQHRVELISKIFGIVRDPWKADCWLSNQFLCSRVSPCPLDDRPRKTQGGEVRVGVRGNAA